MPSVRTISLSSVAAAPSRKKISSSIVSSLICMVIFAAAVASSAQTAQDSAADSATTITTLASFDGGNGVDPQHANLLQGFDGNFYGVAYNGGGSETCGFFGCGTVFKVTTGGTITTLHTFSGGSDGAFPYGTLVQSSSGMLYGATHGTATGSTCSGAGGCGTVFEITTSGTLTTLHTFKGSDGNGPNGLIQGTDGNFYGTTGYGGAHKGGTVFKITSSGTLTTLYSFCTSSGCTTQSAYPLAALTEGTDGNYYGTTGGVITSGCPLSCGTFFKVTSSGTLTTLHTFDGSDGAIPHGVTQGTDGNFYGSTVDGGSSKYCSSGCGTVFKVTTAGTLTTLHSFCLAEGCSDGKYPEDGLTQGTDGDFYGTTSFGGGHSDGTIFKITTGGTLTTVESFDSTDGKYPSAGVMQSTNGEFYGTAMNGGNAGDGDIYCVSEGLAAFVATNPTSGAVGAKITIVGTDLTGASSVTFNGKSATYTVVSSSEITATVPTGATTGTLEVKTSAGTLKSNVEFTVN